MRYFLLFLINLVSKRWNILLLIIIFVTIPLLFIQYAMIKEQSDSLQNWFLFDDRNILNDASNRNSQFMIINRLQRPADYCNLPIAKFQEDEKALGNNWKLKYLFVFLRHGQRASINSMTDANYQYQINCSLRQFLSFKIHDWKEFMNSFDHSDLQFTKFDMKGVCKETQLTLMGILQMFILGSRFNNAYQQFLKRNLPLIYSTPYQRTVLSAEILQYQLLKNSDNYQHNAKILESTSIAFCRPDFNVSCECPSLRYFYSKYNRFKTNYMNQNLKCTQIINKFNEIFMSKQYSIHSLLNLFDIVSSALCASNLDEISKSNVFCWPLKGAIINQEPWSFLYKSVDGSEVDEPENISRKKINDNPNNRCIPLNLIVDLWNCVDDMTEKVNNYIYFQKYSKLAAYPILSQIISKVLTKESISDNNMKNNKPHNLVIYVGHDHTLRYLLSALDFKRSMDKSIHNVINVWPGFASRLSLEIFQKVNNKPSEIGSLKFRLLFNGLIITSALTFCPSDKSFCDFDLFKHYLSSNDFWKEAMFSTTQYSTECTTV